MTNKVYKRNYGFRSKSSKVISNRRSAGRKILAKFACKNKCRI